MNKLVKDYLSAAHILIVDQSPSIRIGLKKALTDMGANSQQIYLAGTITAAELILQENKPRIVLCDYQIDGTYGLDLIQKQREIYHQEKNLCLFFLVTSNTSQSAVAQAAEEDVDAYILKPYTIDGLRSSIARAILSKIEPSDYFKLIEDGKVLLERNQFDEAISVFQMAVRQDDKPSLAHFYEGLTYFKKELLDNSQCSYESGLSSNKIHYKCLVGLFDLLLSMKKYEQAYEVVQRIIKYFPANPKRLASVLKLAIQTGHYSDIELFYAEYIKIEDRDEELIRAVCAALIVCGKHFLNMNQKENGLNLLFKASVSAGGRHLLLKKIVEVLVQFSHITEARMVLRRFSNPSDEDEDYSSSSKLILELEEGLK